MMEVSHVDLGTAGIAIEDIAIEITGKCSFLISLRLNTAR